MRLISLTVSQYKNLRDFSLSFDGNSFIDVFVGKNGSGKSNLWNRNIVDQPRLPSSVEQAWVTPFETDTHVRARCFLLLKITRHLLRVVNPRSSWPDRMKAHLLAFPDLSHLGLNLAGMGVPGGWEADW